MDEYQILLDIVRQTFASVVWTHKIQEKQADIYNERYEFISRYQELAVRLNKIYSEIPTTTSKAVERASEALKTNEEFTYSEEEIDRFLPPTLRGRLK